MEFTHGRRERFFVSTRQRQEEQQVQVAGGGPPLLMVSSPSSSSNLRGGNWMVPEREQMFEKVVTPSDVGKLNRLVIPKQHAERYFPMDAAADGGKGLLLSFEDRTGKAWRFRYSYWNSSQSYVMTKGWSRFVKEKHLDAGDTVCFSRGGDRLFIDWKKRRVRDPFTVAAAAARGARINLPFTGFSFGQPPMVGPWGTTYPSFLAPSAATPAPGSQIVFFQAPPPVEGRPADVSVVLDSTPSSGSRQAAAKGLRLFGVNLFCSGSEGGRETQVSSSPASVSKEHKHSSSLNLDL